MDHVVVVAVVIEVDFGVVVIAVDAAIVPLLHIVRALTPSRRSSSPRK